MCVRHRFSPPSIKSTNKVARRVLRDKEMSLEVQLMNMQEQPSHIKREICAAIEVSLDQLFLIRSGSRDHPRRYVPPERLLL